METTDILAALDAAIRGEEEAQAFYLKAAEQTDDPKGCDMFRELAEFEGHHKEHLEGLRASLAAGETVGSYQGRDLPEYAEAKIEGAGAATPGEHADALEALRVAIAAEERAASEYRALAEGATDETGQQMFARLAEEEVRHSRLLNDQFYSLTNHGIWLWGD